jgi:ATP-binding cassette subfamily B (MDR/TAP) protein 1
MYKDASQIANDAVGSIRTVASFCAEERVMQLYEENCEGPVKAGIKEGLISGIGYGMANFFLFNVYAITFYAGAQLVKDGKANCSDVFRVR